MLVAWTVTWAAVMNIDSKPLPFLSLTAKARVFTSCFLLFQFFTIKIFKYLIQSNILIRLIFLFDVLLFKCLNLSNILIC